MLKYVGELAFKRQGSDFITTETPDGVWEVTVYLQDRYPRDFNKKVHEAPEAPPTEGYMYVQWNGRWRFGFFIKKPEPQNEIGGAPGYYTGLGLRGWEN